MTLDEAIKRAEEIADTCEYEASRYDMTDAYESYMACQEGECGEKYRQLAEWLRELKELKEQQKRGHWIPDTGIWGNDAFTIVDGYTCSKCGEFDIHKDNFCPICGAYMWSAEDE